MKQIFLIPILALGLVLTDESEAKVHRSGYVGTYKKLERRKTIPIDKGVTVHVELGIKGEGADFGVFTPDGKKISIQNEREGAKIRGQDTRKFEFKTPDTGEVEVRYLSRSKKPGWVKYLFVYERRIELKLKVTSGFGANAKRAVRLRAHLQDRDGTILRYASSKVKARIIPPHGKRFTVRLYDDGSNNDGDANDGVFGVVLKNLENRGTYEAIATLVAIREDPPFERSARESFEVLIEFN